MLIIKRLTYSFTKITFMYISNFKALFSRQFDSHRNINRSTFCHFCRFHSPNVHKFIIHLRYCLSLKKQAYISLPQPTKTITLNEEKITIPNKIKV